MCHPKSCEHNTFSNSSDESQFNFRLKKNAGISVCLINEVEYGQSQILLNQIEFVFKKCYPVTYTKVVTLSLTAQIIAVRNHIFAFNTRNQILIAHIIQKYYTVMSNNK